MELDFIRAGSRHEFGRFDGIFHRIPREVEDDVGTDPEGIVAEHHHGIDVFCRRMAAVNLGQGLVVGRLEAQLDEDVDAVLMLYVGHDVEIGFIEAVRPGGNGKTYDIGPAGRRQEVPETVGRQVGIGKILKVGDEFIGLVFRLDMGHILLDLLLDGHRGRQVFIAGADGAAEGTAPDAQGTVAVGTGIGDADGQLIYFFSVSFF